MSMLFVFTAVGLVLFIIGLAALVWSIRSGQMDDLDTPAMRMLHDNASPKLSPKTATPVNSPVATPTDSTSSPVEHS